MKVSKRILSFLLVLMLALSLSVTAFAAEGDDATTTIGSITVDNAVIGKTYTIYRIFDLNSHNDDYSAINYKVNPDWSAFFAAGAEGLNYVNVDSLGYVTWKEGADAAEFAAKAFTFATDNGIAHNGTTKATSGTVKFEKLALGYYLAQSDLGALCSLDTTMPNVNIEEKNGKPTVEKLVKENSINTFGKTNDANIGDTVEFQTTINVVDGAPKNYVLHDTMDAGLTFNSDSVVVKIGVNTLEANKDYTLSTENLEDGCAFEIAFVAGVLKPNDVVKVSYTALLNGNATVGSTGNVNETKLTYGNNDSTESSKTNTYTWPINVFKYTKDGETEKALAGAVFTLSKNEDGSSPIALVKTADNTYRVATADDETTVTAITTDETGKFSISGLDAGKYYLTETTAPAGYNLLSAPVEIEISATIDGTTKEGTVTVTYNKTSIGEVKVENKTGTELPSTGGIGTTIFYVLGGLLVAGAAILLVTKKRMSKAK